MKLPDFLTMDNGGFIHVSGHRVGLNHLIRAYDEGMSAEEIAMEFPSIPLAIIHKVIAFRLENDADVRKYLDEQDAIIAEYERTFNQGPTLGQLRKKVQKHRVPRANAG